MPLTEVKVENAPHALAISPAQIARAIRNNGKMSRAIWTGSISFGLVNIPIALYTATRREELKFRLLRKSDLSPVNYKRVAEKDGKEVPWDQIVKGYEYEKGRYVVLKEEDFQRVDLEVTQTVDIQDFVDQEEIDPMFLAVLSGATEGRRQSLRAFP
jgi:non-homologous end joining protein Ku